jgi:hypothetical protein
MNNCSGTINYVQGKIKMLSYVFKGVLMLVGSMVQFTYSKTELNEPSVKTENDMFKKRVRTSLSL